MSRNAAYAIDTADAAWVSFDRTTQLMAETITAVGVKVAY